MKNRNRQYFTRPHKGVSGNTYGTFKRNMIISLRRRHLERVAAKREIHAAGNNQKGDSRYQTDPTFPIPPRLPAVDAPDPAPAAQRSGGNFAARLSALISLPVRGRQSLIRRSPQYSIKKSAGSPLMDCRPPSDGPKQIDLRPH